MSVDSANSGSRIPTWSLDSLQNIGHALTETSRRMPQAVAVACPSPKQQRHQPTQFETITFAELETRSNQIARGIVQMGIAPGTRLALMVPPGIAFVAWVFGLFKAGVVIILIDPGMGRRNMIRCLAAAKPAGFVGIPQAQLVRQLCWFRFPDCRQNIVLGRWPGCRRAVDFEKLEGHDFPPVDVNRESSAAIIFTTGSTGPPKGVLYRHRIFLEQTRQIRDYFQIQPGTVDVSGFPLFALFNAAMGTTTVFPKMDPTRPASVHPPEIIHAVQKFQANQSFGSPALWNTVSKYCLKHSIMLPEMQRILSAGAPVPANVLQRIQAIIAPDGEAFTPYGATESLPIACNSAQVILGETAARTARGEGTCVGHRFPDIDWRVIQITDGPLPQLSDCQYVPNGEIGELMVRGLVVTDQYVTGVEANALHKVADGDSFWHRLGDVGYLDEQDRFWFCGRKSHRLTTARGTLFTIPCEAIINTHPAIYRCALVGIGAPGQQIPVIVAEPLPEHWPRQRAEVARLLEELKAIARQHWQTEHLQHFLLHRSLPVDIRHNAKIFREQLRPWAAKKINRYPPIWYIDF